MCQLNLYIVPKTVKKEKVLDLMKKYFYYDKPECVTEENLLYEVQDENNVYVSAGMGCNCGTVQSSFAEEDKKMPWIELKNAKIQAEQERIAKIKELIEQEDFLERKNKFYQKLEELNNARMSASGKDAEELLLETQKLIQENGLILETMTYEFQKIDDGKAVITFNSNEDLQNTQKRVCENFEKEFENIKAFVDEVLKEAEDVKLLSFWQDGDLPKIESEEYVWQDEFKIEDVIYMKYNELLTIFKR